MKRIGKNIFKLFLVMLLVLPMAVKALQHYRKELGMEIQDDELKTQYSNYIQYQLTSSLSE